MSIKERKQAKAEPTFRHEPDWAKLEALTDEELQAQIAADPDVAPELDWSLDDPRVRVMVPIDVKAIRAKLAMSQEEFADAFGLTVASVRDWEQQRRVPRGPSLSLLRIIDREPDAARRALSGSGQQAAAAEGG